MGENEQRRQARRQARGLRRVETILDAAAQTFAEAGYDDATTNTIAARAGISPGSLYQFFPNKEAIVRALATRYTEDLLYIHEAGLTPEATNLPLASFVDRVVDPIVAYNRAHPALTLLFGAHVSPHLAGMLDHLHTEVVRRLDAALRRATRASTPPGAGESPPCCSRSPSPCCRSPWSPHTEP